MSSKAFASKRNGNVELMRFVFCILVLLFHINNRMNIKTSGCFSFFANGLIGVEFFFLVSGYLMAMSAEHHRASNITKETARFIYNKIIRIFPIHLFVIAFVMLVYVLENYDRGIYSLIKNLFGFLPNALLLHYSGVRTLHTIPLEWYLSSMLISIPVLYPMLLKFNNTFSRLVCPILSLVLVGYLNVTNGCLSLNNSDTFGGLLKQGVVRAIAEMSLGIFMYEIVKVIKKLNFTKGARIRLTIAELCSYAIVVIYSFAKKETMFEAYMLFFLGIGISITFSEASLFANVFNHKPFYYLGSLSLPIYIIQAIPLKLLEYKALDMMRLRLQIIIVISLTIILAIALKPIFNNISKKWDSYIKSLGRKKE